MRSTQELTVSHSGVRDARLTPPGAYSQHQSMPTTRENNPERLIRKVGDTVQDDLGDIMLVLAKNVEESMLDAGAVPGKDYTILDLYKLAQPFALSIFETRKDVTFATAHF